MTMRRAISPVIVAFAAVGEGNCFLNGAREVDKKNMGLWRRKGAERGGRKIR